MPNHLPNSEREMYGSDMSMFGPGAPHPEIKIKEFRPVEMMSSGPRQKMTEFLADFEPPPAPKPQSTILSSQAALAALPHPQSHLIATLILLKKQILGELEANLPRLLSLNPSRREAVAQYLNRLSGRPHSPQNADSLKKWVERLQTPAEKAALQTYFEEIALVVLGQAILLKAWSDRGLRPWAEGDLGRLNWALSTALKPHIPLDREGWQITRPNLYSWYNLSPALQREIWSQFEAWRFTDEGPSLLGTLLGPVRQSHPEGFEAQGYDNRFYRSVWNSLGGFGFDPAPELGPLKRARIAFSPTLRDGSLIRTGPVSLSWIGLESSHFQLMLAELAQLWWGPASPPIWTIGTGLEVHTRDQLALSLSSPKPSLISRLTEMEACDLAFVLEERSIRGQGRSLDAQRIREQLESLPYFKKLRAPATSLGILQTCVAINKLRPGGLLCWAREEPLGSAEGTEALNFILERAKLLYEWDFSELEHSLPASHPLFPHYFYLFARESNVEARLAHRPQRIVIQGQIRSHVEMPLVLEDAFQSARQEVEPRGHWKAHRQESPNTQKEWMERWPDPTSQNVLRSIEHLRAISLPLANSVTIRHTPTISLPKSAAKSQDEGWTVHPSLHGFWIHAESNPDGRRLMAKPLPRPGREATGSGFLILVPDDGWIAPLSAYLQSESVRTWLDHHAERRGEKWVLSEQVVKWIPVPKVLLRALGAPATQASDDSGANPSVAFALPLPGEWERIASEVAYHPKQVREALTRLPADESAQEIRAAIFVRTARALENLQNERERLTSLVGIEGRIHWGEILNILPKGECIAIPFHQKIELSGNLPPQIPIGRIDRVKTPRPGIFLATESGFHLHISSPSGLILDILWEQLQGITHPTWNELVQYLRVPRRIELAETTASDILRLHGEQSLRFQELSELLFACSLF